MGKVKQKFRVCYPEINESNLMAYLVCMLMSSSPGLSVLEDSGTRYGNGAANFFRTNRHLKRDAHLWDPKGARACYVNTACADEELIRNYIQHPRKEGKKNKDITSFSG